MKKLLIILTGLILSIGAEAKGPDKTMKNLQQAYAEEMNSARLYDALSQKAIEEGHFDISKVFCAISESEMVHMNNHKEAIEALGGMPGQVVYEPLDIKSTRKNLRKQIKHESEQAKFSYGDFLKDARDEQAQPAVESFRIAKEGEEAHAVLLRDALDALESGTPMGEDYYVSTKTGEIIDAKSDNDTAKFNMEGQDFVRVE